MIILTLSDIHSGSTRGLNPIDKIKSHHLSNQFNEWIYEKFTNDFIKTYKNPDYLILNGDICDGAGQIDEGVFQFTTSGEEQVNWAVELLKPLIGKNTVVVGITGSGYHVNKRIGSNLDRQVIEKLNGKYKSNIFELEFESEKIQWKHDSGITISSLEREIKNITEDSVKSKTKVPTWLIRSHGHMFLRVDKPGTKGIQTPCWQYLTDFMEKGKFKGTPDIGAFILEYHTTKKLLYGYEKLYNIPAEIHDEMRNLEVLDRKKISELKKKEDQEFYEFRRNKK